MTDSENTPTPEPTKTERLSKVAGEAATLAAEGISEAADKTKELVGEAADFVNANKHKVGEAAEATAEFVGDAAEKAKELAEGLFSFGKKMFNKDEEKK